MLIAFTFLDMFFPQASVWLPWETTGWDGRAFPFIENCPACDRLPPNGPKIQAVLFMGKSLHAFCFPSTRKMAAEGCFGGEK